MIRTARMSKGLTQKQLAEQMGVTRAAVANWETGVSSPTAESLIRLARILGTTVDALLADDTNNEKEEQNNGR